MKAFIKQIFNQSKSVPTIIGTGLTLAFMLSSIQHASGQEYVVTATGSANNLTLAPASVTNASAAEGSPDTDFAILKASGYKATILTYSSDATLSLHFTNAIATGKKAYIRIKQPVTTGISLDLGSLANLLGLLSNNTINVTTNAGTAEKHLVKDAANNLYIAVSSSVAYNNISIKLDFGNSMGLLGIGVGDITLEVGQAVTYESIDYTPCESISLAFADIDPQATGISLTLSDALQDPQKAIDGNVNADNYSVLQNGTVATASNVYQTVYLGKTVPGTNEILATVSKPGALLNLNVLGNITVQAYLGTSPVGSAQSIQSALVGLGLLTAFDNNNLVTFSFVPGGVGYDRIVVRSQTILNANLFTGIRIHELGSRPPMTFSGGEVAGTVAGNALGSTITAATMVLIPVIVPGFSIGCGTPSDYTYRLSNVDQGLRVLGGALPPSLSLTEAGILEGSTVAGDQGTYTFDVEASNVFGQKKVAQFVVTISAPLPVTLIDFKARAEGQTALLNWETTSETNSDRFEVERSGNGKSWAKIGSIVSNHESTSLQRYFFTDASPLEGANLYRLKMIDLDGTFAHSSIANLTFSPDAAVKIYPNPVVNSENLQISVVDWSKVKTVKIVNAIGKTIFESSGSLTAGIKTGYFTSGLYVVLVTRIDGKTDIQKFVKL